MTEDESNVLNMFKEKIEEAMHLLPDISSSSAYSNELRLWRNALQEGNDVQFNLSTSENGVLYLTLVESNDHHSPVQSNADISEFPNETIKNDVSTSSNYTLFPKLVEGETPEEIKPTSWELFDQTNDDNIAHFKITASVVNNKVLESADVASLSSPFGNLADNLQNQIKHGSSGGLVMGQPNLSEVRKIHSPVENHDFDDAYDVHNTTALVRSDTGDNKSTIIVSVVTDDAYEDDLNASPEVQQSRCLNANPSCFPCVRPEWYVVSPVNNQLVDDNCRVNTNVLAADLRAFLKKKSISLDNFSVNYLERSQGTLSDLLNHPKPWKSLSQRGKAIYFKMMRFLSSNDLDEMVSNLKKGSLHVRPGRSLNTLPKELMDLLENNQMPSEALISATAAVLQLNTRYLHAHCEMQAKAADDEKVEDGGDVFSGRLKPTPASIPGRKKSRSFRTPLYNEKHICPVGGCGQILRNKASLDCHLLVHSGDRPHQCDVCKKRVSTISNLRVHQRRHSKSGKMTAVSKRAQKAAELRDGTSPKDEPPKEPSGGDKISRLEEKTPEIGVKKDDSECVYVCGVCATRFPSSLMLHTHVITRHSSKKFHNQQRVFTCNICSKSLKTMTSLAVHLRTHSGKLPYHCTQCGKRFRSKANCLRHTKTHKAIKRHHCSECSATFTEARSVAIHMRIHTGEKPFECEVCGKKFAQSGPLISHRLVHTGFRPYLCEICGRSFRQKTNLRSHSLRHLGIRNHSCTVCSRVFQYKNDLRRHITKHNRERPYACNICHLTFTSLQYLKDHTVKVHETSSFKCKQCNREFPTTQALEEHQVMESKAALEQSQTEKLLTNAESQVELSEAEMNGVAYASAILQVLSNAMGCISPLSPGGSDAALSAVPSITNAMTNDRDPSFSASDVPTSFDVVSSENRSLPVTLVTNQNLVFSSADDMDTSLLGAGTSVGEVSDSNLAMVSKISLSGHGGASCPRVVGDPSDPNMQSVIVTQEDCTIEEGTQYVVVDVSDNVATIASDTSRGIVLGNPQVE